MRDIEWTRRFQKELNKLSKKHRGFKDKVIDTLKDLEEEKIGQGDPLPRIGGYSAFKVRVPVGNRGKSSGARLIYYKNDDVLWAISIYTKNSKGNITDEEIRRLIEDILSNQSDLPEDSE